MCNGTTTLRQLVQQAEHSSAAPAGLVIDATTGVIDLGATTAQTYTSLTALEQHHVQELLLRK